MEEPQVTQIVGGRGVHDPRANELYEGEAGHLRNLSGKCVFGTARVLHLHFI